MLLSIVCGVLFLAGLVMIVAWGGLSVQTPPAATLTPVRVRALRRYLWWVTLATVAGVVPGILTAGAGGRLVMRVLALTSPQSTGRLTEAGALVGHISPEGTLTLLLFGAIPAGYLSAVLYLCIQRWLPRGRLNGVTFGLLLLLVLAAPLDPLRADNPDFDFIGPGWLALVLFSLLVVVQGMLVAAIAGRYSRHLPLFKAARWLPYSPLLATIVFFPVAIAAGVGAVFVALFAPALPPIERWLRSRGATWIVRGILAVVVLIALPTFIRSVITLAAS